jgi:photosynthetic reaction center H subunit
MQPDAYMDVAQVTLYVFWIFFACLIYYLRREDKREGYPLESNTGGGGVVHGLVRMPTPKTYKLSNGHTATLPNDKNNRTNLALAPTAPWPGAPLEPTGNAMLDGVGPGSYANREDVAELSAENVPVIVPLRLASGITLAARDPDPRGMNVIGADREVAGVVTDVWVDRAEMLIRYLEVQVAGGGKKVLLPMPFASVNSPRGRITVGALLGAQFANVPTTKSPDQVTKLEEDKIVGYYGAGTLYATPDRQEPLL